MPHSQGLSNNPYPEQNQPNSSYDTYFFKIHSNIVLPSMPRSFESTPTFFHSGYMICPSRSSKLNHPYYIRRTVQTTKFLIVEPSPLTICQLDNWIQGTIIARETYNSIYFSLSYDFTIFLVITYFLCIYTDTG